MFNNTHYQFNSVAQSCPTLCNPMNCSTPGLPVHHQLLEENIGKTLSDMNHSRILYDPPPRVMEIKAKISKWDLIKLKSFCTTKENYKQDEKTAFIMEVNISK